MATIFVYDFVFSSSTFFTWKNFSTASREYFSPEREDLCWCFRYSSVFCVRGRSKTPTQFAFHLLSHRTHHRTFLVIKFDLSFNIRHQIRNVELRCVKYCRGLHDIENGIFTIKTAANPVQYNIAIREETSFVGCRWRCGKVFGVLQDFS